MKERVEKILPWGMMLAGGLSVLREMFPGRLGFLSLPGAQHYRWTLWMLGLAGVIWLILQRMPASEAEKAPAAASFFRKYGIEILILAITAASLSMLIHSGYYWDDARNAVQYLAEKKDSVSTLAHVLEFMRSYLHLGRINVLSVYYYFFFYIEDPSIYKALIILLILADQIIFRKTLLEFEVPLSGARMGMLLIPLMLQTRVYQDPVSGFYGLMQVLTAEMLLTAFFLSRWMRGGKRRHLALSLLCFGIGMMTYEVCFPFLAMICLLIWVRRRDFLRAVRESLPFVGLVLVMAAGVAFVRARFVSNSTYSGVAFSLDPQKILQTWWTQFTAGLPLSFYSAAYGFSAVLHKSYAANTFMHYDFRGLLSAIELTDLLILAASAAVFAMIRPALSRRTEEIPELPVLGLCFAVLPTITVSLSQRYQGQLVKGIGYLPVYMQYFGIAILLLWLTLRLKSSAGVRALCLSAFAVILLLNLQNNRGVTEVMNRSFYYPRSAGEEALRGGILDFLPEDSVLLADNDRHYLWEADWNHRGLYTQFYQAYSRRAPDVIGDSKVLQDAVDAALANGAVPDKEGYITLRPENVWIISYNGGPDRGLAKLGRLDRVEVRLRDLSVREAMTDHVLYFISGDFPEQAAIQYSDDGGKFFSPLPDTQYRVRQSDHGILFQLPEEQSIRFDSLAVSPEYR